MARLKLVAPVAAIGMLIALVCPVRHASTQTTQGGSGTTTGISIVEAEAPPGTETLAVQWVRVAAPNLGVMLAAVARPRGAGPFPTVVLLHGTHGFAHEYVRLAQDLASGGDVVAVAACWFRGSAGSGTRFITPIACPDGPPMSPPASPESLQALTALVQAVRTLPGAHPDRIGLFGHSRGSAPIISYIVRAGDVRAAILNYSAGYPAGLSTEVKAPILILHGTADSPADGGVAVTNIQMARDFEAKLRAAGKPVEAVYYEGGRHNDIFTSATQYRDEVQKMVTFLRRHLRE
jgi:dipeptidyl aminopeptidase/acylaminoacyl peptidase